MRFTMVPQVLGQMFRKPFTNKFPAKYAPASTTNFLADVAAGKTELIPPIETPENFRGKITYERDTCIGCKLCIKVCPTDAIEYIEENKKIKIYLSRCCFCAQCNDVCPANCLKMSDEFLLAETDKYAKDLIIE